MNAWKTQEEGGGAVYDQNFYGGGAGLREVTMKDAWSGVGILSKTA